ncbi:zinc finger BED domain-containing protein RICESLEEPER 2, partial [Tanacetum coccineum]
DKIKVTEVKILDLLEQRIFRVGKHLKKEKEKMDINKRKEKMVMERAKKSIFPFLSRMAMDVISVQATSVASESAFSISERVLSIRRSRLTPASLEMCMCLKDHLDAQEHKQDKSSLENAVDFEEEILDAEVQ